MPVATATVAFSLRNLRRDLRDRLHALAAIRETQVGHRVTIEETANEVIQAGLEALEPGVYGTRLAAKLAQRNGHDG